MRRRGGLSQQFSAAVNTLDDQMFMSQSPYNLGRSAELYDDFIYGVAGASLTPPLGQLSWELASAASLGSVNSQSGRPGILKFTTLGYTTMYLRPLPCMQYPSMWVASFLINPSSVNLRARFGFAGVGSTEPTEGVYFKNAGGNWIAVTRAASTSTETNTGIAQNTSFKQFKIVIPSSTEVEFYIDDILKAIHTTNLPTGTAEMSFVVGITDAVEREMNVDYFQGRIINLNR